MCLWIWRASGEQLACRGWLVCVQWAVLMGVFVYAGLFDTLYQCRGKDAAHSLCAYAYKVKMTDYNTKEYESPEEKMKVTHYYNQSLKCNVKSLFYIIET